jgi:hypothetical protein
MQIEKKNFQAFLQNLHYLIHQHFQVDLKHLLDLM